MSKVEPGSHRKSKMETVKVKITAKEGLGTHKNGAIVEMAKSTAEAVIKSGKAEKSGSW